MAKHIGIVACSAEGAALCYTTICVEGASHWGKHGHPEVSMHNTPLSRYMAFIYEDNWQGVADLMIHSAEKLKAAGAELLVCPDNTIHQAFPLMKNSSLPWLHIAEEVALEAARHGYRNLFLTGTKYLMEGPVYKEKLSDAGIQWKIPEEEDRIRINRIIFDELVNGIFREECRRYFIELISRKMDEGCDAVILGCTEIPLLIAQKDSPLPILDSTRILARAALREAKS